jgi:hypothetical protein
VNAREKEEDEADDGERGGEDGVVGQEVEVKGERGSELISEPTRDQSTKFQAYT